MERCFGRRNGPGLKLDDILGTKEDGTQAKRLYAFDKSDNAIIAIDKNRIDSKSHEKHMDRLTFRNHQRFSSAELHAAQKSFHARPECIGQPGVLGNNRIFAFIEDLHRSKGKAQWSPTGKARGTRVTPTRPLKSHSDFRGKVPEISQREISRDKM